MVTMALEGIDKVQTYLMLIVIKIMDMGITPWVILFYIALMQWKEAVFFAADLSRYYFIYDHSRLGSEE